MVGGLENSGGVYQLNEENHEGLREAANVVVQTFGGYGFDAEYDVERKFRETRLYQVAPISTNLILSCIAEHVLGLPRSF